MGIFIAVLVVSLIIYIISGDDDNDDNFYSEHWKSLSCGK